MTRVQRLRKGCWGYLYSVMLSSSEDLCITDIPVVCDFLEVFPDELSRIPINRDIEFSIEVTLGTHPISKAPYSLSPAKLNGVVVIIMGSLLNLKITRVGST